MVSYIVNRLAKTSEHLGVIFMSVVALSGLVLVILPTYANAYWGCCILPIPNHLFTPPNQGTVLGLQAINPGLNIPSNLVMAPQCSFSCPPIIGTLPGSIVIATGTTDASIYGLGGNNVLQCGQGACKAVAGPGNNILLASTSSTIDNNRLYGGFGNNIFIGGIGSTTMIGGKLGNDQFYAGIGHDIMIGGRGANYFDCGLNGNGVILNFSPAKGDTKSPDCKFVITVPSNSIYPGSSLPPA
jgi:RTX calcium-binding nonapeptide repeat (4 copies)